MKKLIFLFIVTLLAFWGNAQPCYTGLYFSTQAEIDAFPVDYPNCTEIHGNVIISGEDISNLNGLSAITYVEGYLEITRNDILTSLSGLNNLETVEGYLSLSFNPLLVDCSGLSALTSAGGFSAVENTSMVNFSGLNSLTSLTDGLIIENNPELTSLTGLDGLSTINGWLAIGLNPQLTSCEIQGICDVLSNQSNLNRVNVWLNGPGCSNTAQIQSSCGIPVTCPGNIFLSSQAEIDEFPSVFADCTEITGNLQIFEQTEITNLNGLSQIKSVFWLGIAHCKYLDNLTGLGSLKSIATSLEIRSNSNITSLSDLSSLTSIGWGVFITNNPLLSNCEIQAVCDYLSTPNNIVYILENAQGCNSPEEVLEVCQANCIGSDDDCDGVANTCDVCPGGDDSIDNDNNGLPDCKYPPVFGKIIPAWKCGGAKVYVCHSGVTLCIHKKDLAAHIAHGDYLGPCGNASCDQGLTSSGGNDQIEAFEELERITASVTLHPNPATAEAWLNLSYFEGIPCQVRVTDLRSAILLAANVDSNWSSPMRLDLSGLAPGMYFVQVFAENGEAQILRMIIGR